MFLSCRFAAATFRAFTTASLAVLPVVTSLVAVDLLLPKAAQAQRFNPTDASPSLGYFPTTAGTYTFDTTGVPHVVLNQVPKHSPSSSTAPVVTGPGGYVRYGTFKNGCALFNFDSLAISATQHLVGKGSHPLVLLSKGSVSIAKGSSIRVAGSNGTGVKVKPNFPYMSSGGAGGAGGGKGGDGSNSSTSTKPTAGSGPGGGAAGDPFSNGGGAYGTGGAGGVGSKKGVGGSSYGTSPAQSLSGGSGAGGTLLASGGGGGGALEISAAKGISVAGSGDPSQPTLCADGGQGDIGESVHNDYWASGGGSGGTIYLTSPTVTLSGVGTDVLSATGGAGAWNHISIGDDLTSVYGGPGAGGRVRIEQTKANPPLRTPRWARAGVLLPIGSDDKPVPPPSTGAATGEVVFATLSPYTP